jgi:hypothetical protein
VSVVTSALGIRFDIEAGSEALDQVLTAFESDQRFRSIAAYPAFVEDQELAAEHLIEGGEIVDGQVSGSGWAGAGVVSAAPGPRQYRLPPQSVFDSPPDAVPEPDVPYLGTQDLGTGGLDPHCWHYLD